MIIVEKIVQDYENNQSILFCKNTPEIFITKIPSYPINTKLTKGIDGLFHPLEEDEKIQKKDAFFSEVHLFFSLQIIDDLLNDKENVYEKWINNPYALVDKKYMISVDDICRINNPSTFKAKLDEIIYITRYIIHSMEDKTGSVCFQLDKIYRSVNNFLKRYNKGITVKEFIACINYAQSVFYLEKTNGGVKRDAPIGLFTSYSNEIGIYNYVKEKAHLQTPFIDYDYEYDEYLSEEQNEAARDLVLQNGCISILSGGPGTGKTTIIKKIVNTMRKSYPEEKIALLSPTGKAVKRIAEVINRTDVHISTIHKFLSYQADGEIKLTKKKRKELLDFHFVIIDEVSMLGSALFYNLLKHLDMNSAKVILVGDIYQLSSVDPGALLRDLRHLGVYTKMLNNNFRSDGQIVSNSILIKNGETDLVYDESFELVDNGIEQAIEEMLEKENDIEKAKEEPDIFFSPFRDERFKYSTTNINNQIHEKKYYYHLKASPKKQKFMLQERVIVTKTCYEAKLINSDGKVEKLSYINGDTGRVINVEPKDGSWIYDVELNGCTCKIPEEHLDYGYALTIHKSQGSEYQTVHIIIPEFKSFITRNMLYTAVTRAKKKVIIHSTKEIIAQIINNNIEYDIDTFLYRCEPLIEKRNI